MTITQAQEEAALEFLKRHAVLYDRSLKEYKDTSKRDSLWQKLADRLHTETNPITKEDIKKWFESQRTVFGKCTRLQSGQAAPGEEAVGGHPIQLPHWTHSQAAK